MEKLSQSKIDTMFQEYKDLGEEAFTMSHYALTDSIGHTPEEWRAFFVVPKIADWIAEEQMLLRQTKMAQLINTLGNENKTSVGVAQQITSLQKILETGSAKTGDAFVYCYIPLNEEQTKAQNVQTMPEDIFAKEPEVQTQTIS